MARKRRRIGAETSPQSPSSLPLQSRTQTGARLTSAPQNAVSSSPRLPTLPRPRRDIRETPMTYEHTLSPNHDADIAQIFDIEADDDIREREESDAMNEIIMAVDMKERGTIGCAYYVAREEKLCVMEDIKMAGLETIDTLKLHVQPTVILISTRSDERLEEHLRRDARGIDRGDEASEFILYIILEVANMLYQTTYLALTCLILGLHLTSAM